MSILRVIQPSIAPPEWNVVQSQRQAIAILLLDAENIKLGAEEERFLETCCNHSLQIKIAFANWRAVSKQQDLELHERGYQMIHVPTGKNSADMKMTAIGSSLFVAYPNVKEVLVCSSDNDLAHLCNTLQVYGLTAYAVRKQSETLHVTNIATGQVFNHQQQILPPIEECLNSIKALIQQQQQLTSSQWVELSWLSKKFQETHGFTLSQLVSHHTPGQETRDLFVYHPGEFVIHQSAEKKEIYICLFIPPELKQLTQVAPSFRSRQQLEKALLKILNTQTVKTDSEFILLNTLLSEFQKQYEKPLKHFWKLSLSRTKPLFL
ncbi:MAG: NYN domain-containing protein [Leptolyngbyaceae cyanobacterium CSU_1_4]|nr:NYN domain-containing protein [Leptolyngbyaceae cyanobacterium CSU_1_4]